MELTRKIIIYTAFIGFGFIALSLRMWVLGPRQYSFKKEIRINLIILFVLAVIASIVIYVNN